MYGPRRQGENLGPSAARSGHLAIWAGCRSRRVGAIRRAEADGVRRCAGGIRRMSAACSMDGGLMAVTADLAKVLDKAYEDKTLAELVDAPVSALAGSARATPSCSPRLSTSRRSGTSG